jgi:hypothetical protein
MSTAPMVFRWHEGAMVPLHRFARMAHQQYEPDQTYFLGEVEERSKRSHDHFFATVDEVFDNLPDEFADRWAAPDELRYWALIKTGFHHRSEFVCASKAEAPRLAAFLRQIEGYAIVVVRDAVVTRYVAKSQSKKAMGAADFQDSKAKVLDILAELIGVPPEQLSSAAREPASVKSRAGAAA